MMTEMEDDPNHAQNTQKNLNHAQYDDITETLAGIKC